MKTFFINKIQKVNVWKNISIFKLNTENKSNTDNPQFSNFAIY